MPSSSSPVTTSFPDGHLARWRLLDLHDDGTWHVSPQRYAKFKERIAMRLLKETSVFNAVQVYNNATFMLRRNLGPALALLGESHWRDIAIATMADFHENTFSEIHENTNSEIHENTNSEIHENTTSENAGVGARRGVVDLIRNLIHSRFQISLSSIVEAWYYWPLTAGGLSLENPVLNAMSVLFGMRVYKKEVKGLCTPTSVPWDALANVSCLFADEQHPQHAKLVNSWSEEFNERRRELFGDDDNEDIRPYWKWMISTYGEQIRSTFSMFNFLEK
eukprot:CAMPEP_0113847850 /NCGR_PEP_ID=MMETSP0372-20130328/2116_1 /TAXON_ID=340204 /ORGANISM="Lankesteria abbotti" /LENGTH=276 /DNA_ID=CAMNT_0000817199 /DNA_START=264 /DNA_END=1091 /DNA_ORIENTATION=- /assembly_acc=CAM_ASM_000359